MEQTLSAQCSVLKWLCLATLVLLGAGARAEQPDRLRFTVQATDGTTAAGRLERLEENQSLHLGGTTARFAPGQWLALHQVGRLVPPAPVDEQLVFHNGDRIPGKIGRLVGEDVQLQLAPTIEVNRELRAPLASLAVLWFAPPDEEETPAALLRGLLQGKRKQDRVVLRNGDFLDGILTRLDDKALEFESGRKKLTIPRDKAAAVALSTDLGLPPPHRGTYLRLVHASGARISLANASCADGKTLVGMTLAGTPLRASLAQVAVLYVMQGRADYLSERKPSRVEYASYLPGLRFDFEGNVTEARLAGNCCDFSLSMHSESRVTYPLDGKYRRFEALVGLDDQLGRGGSVRLEALVDGKRQELGNGQELTARTGPWSVRLDVAGARELTLIVAFGQRGFVQDHVVWAEARLVK